MYDYKEIDDIFIKELKIDIVKEEYIINFMLDGEEWGLIKSCSKDVAPYFYMNPGEEVDFAEMV